MGVPRGILLAFWAFETDYGAGQGDFNTLKEYCGFATTEAIDSIGDQFRAHMDEYAANLPEPQRSYKAALEDLAKVSKLSRVLGSYPKAVLANNR